MLTVTHSIFSSWRVYLMAHPDSGCALITTTTHTRSHLPSGWREPRNALAPHPNLAMELRACSAITLPLAPTWWNQSTIVQVRAGGQAGRQAASEMRSTRLIVFGHPCVTRSGRDDTTYFVQSQRHHGVCLNVSSTLLNDNSSPRAHFARTLSPPVSHSLA